MAGLTTAPVPTDFAGVVVPDEGRGVGGQPATRRRETTSIDTAIVKLGFVESNRSL